MKIILFTSLSLILFACSEKKRSNSSGAAMPAMSKDDSIVHQAKIKADSVFYYMNIAVNEMAATENEKLKKAAAERMNQASKGFQKALDSLKFLVPKRNKEIDDYRQSLLDKVQSETN